MTRIALDVELEKIVGISKDFGADKVVLFGSCLEDVDHARDIDIAVSGITPRKFFDYYGEVSWAVKERVDIVDLEDMRPYFRDCISREGRVLYERKN